MRIAAFDAKQFRRGKVILTQGDDGKSVEKYMGFNTQLGIGVVFNDPNKFQEKYLKKNAELRKDFGVPENLPFFSSTHLKHTLGLSKTTLYADKLITEIQDTVDSIHHTYVILPPAKIKTVQVGGYKSAVVQKPTNQFIDSLGPMFSYLTAQSFLYVNNYSAQDIEFHIDAFRSFRTRSWDNIVSTTSPKVFWRGDECNPFISCADIMAFLTDAKLYDQRLKLEPHDLQKAWDKYSFDVTANFFDDKSLSLYAWVSNEQIDIKPYLAKPTIFLAVDEIEKPEYAENLEQDMTNQIGVGDARAVRKFHEVIKRSDVYYSAIKYAYQKKGAMKIFQRNEDMHKVEDGDVFVYIGSNSKKIGETFQDAYEIELLAGVELRRKIKESDV